MKNLKYLKENNLYDAHKHFMALAEGYLPIPPEELEEAGDDETQQDPMGGDPMAQDGGQNPNGGGMPSMDGGAPQDGSQNPNGGGMPPMDGGAPQDNADPMAGLPQVGDGQMGGDPMADMPPMGDDADEPEDDGSTIDIEDLTKAEDKLNIKQNRIGRDLSKVDTRINTLIDTIGKLQTALDANNSKIESLKAEFEKRNPTQTEKLNLRSLDSYPFNVKPNDYWDEKAKQGGYQAYADNAEPTSQEYVITNNDVDNPTDDIADTFFDIDDDNIQTLEKLFKNF